MARQVVDFLLIGVQNDEWRALIKFFPQLDPLPPSRVDKHQYHIGEIMTQAGPLVHIYRVAAVPILGQGRKKALLVARDAIARWAPRYIILVGIGGGFESAHVMLGDVVVADEIVDYERQRVGTRRVQYRDDVYRADPRLVAAVNRIEATTFFARSMLSRPVEGRPNLHIGQMASGDKVIASARWVREQITRFPRLLGVEMEGAGVAEACAEQSNEDVVKPGFLVVRGVSDLAGPRKNREQVSGWRAYACGIAAEFTSMLLQDAPVPNGMDRWKLPDKEIDVLIGSGFAGCLAWSSAVLLNYSPKLVANDLVRRWPLLNIRSQQVVAYVFRYLRHDRLGEQFSGLLAKSEHELVKIELRKSAEHLANSAAKVS